MTDVYSHSHNYYNYHYCVGNYGENNIITILHYTVNEIYMITAKSFGSCHLYSNLK